jgi:hypothetical protein
LLATEQRRSCISNSDLAMGAGEVTARYFADETELSVALSDDRNVGGYDEIA